MRSEILTIQAYMNEPSPSLSTAQPSEIETIRRNYKKAANNQIFDMARGIFNRASEQNEVTRETSVAWNADAIFSR